MTVADEDHKVAEVVKTFGVFLVDSETLDEFRCIENHPRPCVLQTV